MYKQVIKNILFDSSRLRFNGFFHDDVFHSEQNCAPAGLVG